MGNERENPGSSLDTRKIESLTSRTNRLRPDPHYRDNPLHCLRSEPVAVPRHELELDGFTIGSFEHPFSVVRLQGCDWRLNDGGGRRNRRWPERSVRRGPVEGTESLELHLEGQIRNGGQLPGCQPGANQYRVLGPSATLPVTIPVAATVA